MEIHASLHEDKIWKTKSATVDSSLTNLLTFPVSTQCRAMKQNVKAQVVQIRYACAIKILHNVVIFERMASWFFSFLS